MPAKQTTTQKPKNENPLQESNKTPSSTDNAGSAKAEEEISIDFENIKSVAKFLFKKAFILKNGNRFNYGGYVFYKDIVQIPGIDGLTEEIARKVLNKHGRTKFKWAKVEQIEARLEELKPKPTEADLEIDSIEVDEGDDDMAYQGPVDLKPATKENSQEVEV